MFLISLLIARIATNRLAEVFAIAGGLGLAYRINQTGITKFWEDVSQIVFWTKSNVPGATVQILVNYLGESRLRSLIEKRRTLR